MKIGELKYKPVQGARGLDPMAAAQEFQRKSRFIDDVTGSVNKLAQTVSDVQYESQANVANANAKAAVNEYRKKYENGGPLSMDELDAMGVGDSVRNHPSYKEGMEAVPAFMWYSQGLESVINTSVEEQGDSISNIRARNAWKANAKEAGARQIAGSYATAADQRVKYEYESVDVQRKAAAERGDFEVERELLDNPVYARLPPEVRNEMLNKSYATEEKQGYYDVLYGDDEDAIEDLITDLGDPKKMAESNLTIEERRSLFTTSVTRLNSIGAAEKAARTERSGAVSVDIQQAMIRDGELFDPSIIDAAADNGTLTKEDYRFLTGQWKAQNSGSDTFKTKEGVMEYFETQAFLLEEGLVDTAGSQTWEDHLDKLALYIKDQGYKVDPLTGQSTYNASNQDIKKMSDRLRDLKKAPYASTEYGAVVDELKMVVLRQPADSPFAFLATEQDSLDFQEAVNSLRKYVRKNGADADIEAWRQSTMPRYLQKAARGRFYQLPKSLTDATVFTPDGKIDYDGTRAEWQKSYNVQRANLENPAATDSQKEEARQAQKDIEDRLVEFEAYWETAGKHYVGN